MFTGIVEELGKIQKITSNRITVECKLVLEDAQLGDSIALDGVCLTVTEKSSNSFTADISTETFKITAFSRYKPGDFINLERAMIANGRFGGHIVSGHVDGIGKILSVNKQNEFYNIQIEIPQELSKYVVKKGSITLSGISLTIADVKKNIVSIAIIPHTFANTNLQYLNSGSFVNIEVDILAKYVEKFLLTSDNGSRVNMSFLQENGFLD